MEAPSVRRHVGFAWIVCLPLAWGSPALADAYYTVTDLGDLQHTQVTAGPNGQQISTNTESGVSYAYAFPTTPLIPLTQDQSKQLPGVSVYTGVTNPTLTYFQMTAQGANAQGTVIGTEPSGEMRGSPQVDPIYGYTLPDGHGGYGPFVALTQTIAGSPAPFGTWVKLNNQNQILIQDVTGSRLLDLNTGTTTKVSDLIAPDTLKQMVSFVPTSFSDNGSILGFGGTFGNEEYLLTPSGVPAPVPVPEPTTLATLALGLGGLAYLRRRGAERSTPSR